MGSFRLRRPSPALVVSVIALIVALGGTAYAFSVPKNSVGSKQLKKNAVTTKKIKKGAVTAIKINTTGLTVPNALHANSADSATNAGTASNIAAPEGMHLIGAPGEPQFQHSCHNIGSPQEPTGFYKDREGRVHLQGAYVCPTTSAIAFQLPPGYRPATGSILDAAAVCGGCGTGNDTGNLLIVGPGVATGADGAVLISGGTAADTTGVSFRPST